MKVILADLKKNDQDLESKVNAEIDRLTKEFDKKIKDFTILESYKKIEKIYTIGNVENKDKKLNFLRNLIKKIKEE